MTPLQFYIGETLKERDKKRPSVRPTSPPVLVTDCAHVIRALKGQFWLVQKLDYGFVLRCEFGQRQLRIIILPLISTDASIPEEKGGATYIVQSTDALRAWLQDKYTTSAN